MYQSPVRNGLVLVPSAFITKISSLLPMHLTKAILFPSKDMIVSFLLFNFFEYVWIVVCYGLWRGRQWSLLLALITTLVIFANHLLPSLLFASSVGYLVLGLLILLLMIIPWFYLVRPEVEEYFR